MNNESAVAIDFGADPNPTPLPTVGGPKFVRTKRMKNAQRKWKRKAAAVKGEPTGDSGMSQKVAKLLARAARATGLKLDSLKRQWAATPHEKRAIVRANLEKKVAEIEALHEARRKAQEAKKG